MILTVQYLTTFFLLLVVTESEQQHPSIADQQQQQPPPNPHPPTIPAQSSTESKAQNPKPEIPVQRYQEPVAPVAINVTQTKIIIPNLPPQHYQFWLRNHPLAYQRFQSICSKISGEFHGRLINLEEFQSLHENLTFENLEYLTNFNYGRSTLDVICSKIKMVTKSCWGYENNCEEIYLNPECYGSKLGQAKSKQAQKITWFMQADFGYILDRRKELNRYCAANKFSNESIKSSLECTKYFRTCRAENLYMKFGDIPDMVSFAKQPSGLLKKGNVGGWNCDLQLKRIAEENGQRGYLESWFDELQHYDHVSGSESCDETEEKQVYFVKLDSTTNLYHYFCTFLNLYASMHLNNRFSEDNQIIIWDSRVPEGRFDQTWKAFTRNRLRSLGELKGKRICFKKAIFVLPPRMRDGLYYNTPLIPGCSKTGLFDAFNKHILHRLGVSSYKDRLNDGQFDANSLRVTIVHRSVPYRKVENELALVEAIKSGNGSYQVQVVPFESLKNFRDQLEVAQNTDIMIGMHGAGLTSLLFQPDWAGIIELYDCKDTAYHDLARLRGVHYFTLNDDAIKKLKPPESGDLKSGNQISEAKFSNYEIDPDKFMVVFNKAADRVRKSRSKFVRANKVGGSKSRDSSQKVQPQTKPLSPPSSEAKTEVHQEL